MPKKKPDPQVHISEWWGIYTHDKTLIVLYHQDDPIFQPARDYLSQALAKIIVNAYLREKADAAKTQRDSGGTTPHETPKNV